MRYWILLIYIIIYKDKTFLTIYKIPKTNCVDFYWGHYNMEPTKFLFREKVILNIYFKYRDSKLLLESKNIADETICIDSCGVPSPCNFDTYA
jgi:hypothetical protein